jgi:iron-sulfur cluster assembly accessory protein
MSVASYQPGEQISVTQAASAHIRTQISSTGHKFLRLGVKESGCNGYMYTLDYVDEPTEQDKAFDVADGVCVYVSGQDLPLVAGTEVDLVTEGLNSSLKFKNPNAQSHCGCGESFSVSDDG